ncbi:MAG: pyruvate dehydrogenase (acetyl-transferring) E1 component subunit alpha [Chitinophagales bacterium]|nr:pyruvate dehydrogenase (acetyl-transferring) E1 component subunit alpha [Chitinophagales bacterium]MDW8427717.1 pyruvate dehydrogenase (acetyl-transferring) E1 component subunit alpha [Chitinophagales bacterium]
MARSKVKKAPDNNGQEVALAARPTPEFDKATYLFWYETMLRIRRFEERAGMLYSQQKIRGFCHLYIGQEAVAAGSVTALRPSDPVITAYRDHGLALARGMSARECMAELFGKVDGCSKGKGGSMHFFSKEKNFFGGHGIVGAQIPLGAGIAFAEKYRGTDNVCACYFGDGAARQGALHETFNMAMMWKLPVVFICENNLYAMGTSVQRSSNVTDIYRLGCAYDMPARAVDGHSCEEVHRAIAEAAAHCREGKGPYFLEIKTYRYKGHSMSDPAKYRTKDELEAHKARDPIETLLAYMLNRKLVNLAEVEAINQQIMEEIDEAVAFAEASPFPDPEELYKDNYVQADYPFLREEW